MKRVAAICLLFCLLLGLTACYVQGGTEKVEITFTVTHSDGTEKTFKINTDAETLAQALLAEELVEESAENSGLYDVVDGEKADWDDGEAWWRFSQDGEMLLVGIEEVRLTDGAAFEAVFVRGFSE